jgi:hypothetical protein
MLVGIEYTWGERKNNTDGWVFVDNRLALSFKYSFKQTFGGN